MDEAFGDGDQQLNLDFTIPTLREREREREQCYQIWRKCAKVLTY